jgi:HK97 family phage major capsid protein
MALISGQDPQGFYVPDWFLTRDLTAGVPATAGLTIQTTVEPSLIPLLRNRTAVLQAGARYISGLQGNLLMPRQNAPSTISWNTEIAAVTESDLRMDSVTLSPNRVGGWCNYSKQLLAQSSLDIDNVVRDDMIQVIQIAIDAVALTGTGTNQPTGILNTAANSGLPYNYALAAPTIAFSSGYPTWSQVVAFESNVESGNLVLDDSAVYITTPAVKGAWKTYAKNDPRNATGPYYPMFFWEGGDRVNGMRAIATNQVPANKVVFGKWNELMIGQWAGLDIVVDIYTLATQAEIRVITNMFVDVKYRYASAFCYSTNSGISN